MSKKNASQRQDKTWEFRGCEVARRNSNAHRTPVLFWALRFIAVACGPQLGARGNDSRTLGDTGQRKRYNNNRVYPQVFHHIRVLPCSWPIRGPSWEVNEGPSDCARDYTRRQCYLVRVYLFLYGSLSRNHPGSRPAGAAHDISDPCGLITGSYLPFARP